VRACHSKHIKLTETIKHTNLSVVYLCKGLHDLVDRYGISVSQMTTDMFHLP
jgi:hypothetical protein